MPFKPGQAGAASAAKIASDAHPKRAAASAASVATSPQKRVRRERVRVSKATTGSKQTNATSARPGSASKKHPRQDELTKKEKERLRKRAWRKGRSSKQKEKTKAYDRNRKRDTAIKTTPTEKEQHRSDTRDSMATWRKNLSKQKKAKIASQNNKQHHKSWAANSERRKLEREKKKQTEEDKKWKEIMNTAEEFFEEHQIDLVLHPLLKDKVKPPELVRKNLERARKKEEEDSDYIFEWEDEVEGRFDLFDQLLCIAMYRDKESNLLEDKRRNAEFRERQRKPILPKDDNYKLCNPVEVLGVTYSYQCMFCNDLFIQYPSMHMKECAGPQKNVWTDPTPTPTAEQQKNLEICKREIDDFGTRVCDTSDDWKVRMLPIDSNYALCRPVYNEGEVYHFQCWFCKKLLKGCASEHMEVCSESQYAPAEMLEELISLQQYLRHYYCGRYALSYHYK